MSVFGGGKRSGHENGIYTLHGQSVSPRKSRVALIGEGRLTSNSESKVRSITSGLLPKNSSRMSLTESSSSSQLSLSRLFIRMSRGPCCLDERDLISLKATGSLLWSPQIDGGW